MRAVRMQFVSGRFSCEKEALAREGDAMRAHVAMPQRIVIVFAIWLAIGVAVSIPALAVAVWKLMELVAFLSMCSIGVASIADMATDKR